MKNKIKNCKVELVSENEEELKDWMTSNEENAKKYSFSFQIRSSKNRKKVLFQIN